MRIDSIKQVLSDIVEITTEDGPVFFIRTSYLNSVPAESVSDGAEFSGEKEEDIIQAGTAFAAERKAEEYLARSEQSRFGLERKLTQKKYDSRSIKMALDYLEERNLLDDRRFSLAWLRSHIITKPQGRSRLTSELISRGIKPAVAKESVDEFFSSENEDEIQLCRRALKKAAAAGKKDEKLTKYLLDSGFSFKQIKSCLEEFLETD